MKDKNRTKLIAYCVGVDVLGFKVYEFHEVNY